MAFSGTAPNLDNALGKFGEISNYYVSEVKLGGENNYRNPGEDYQAFAWLSLPGMDISYKGKTLDVTNGYSNDLA